MAYGIIHFFANGTEEQYDAVLQAVHPDKNTLPKGQLYHAAGPSNGGWTVIAVHDSKESWETFKNQILMPKMTAGIKGGFSGPPQETVFECYRFIEGKQERASENRREASM
ncbi:hypothetical protein [Bdellovibrio reynosensis]|uniref:ABM domain-containing protein n=1 Tax=Bdellovibrio reynosensis TaxID=2835041 RepID=A0ABY4C948_9BACT|nr:hypothetical protein [Bdellovibrio reynosensis]UOF01508.1 hypothetical protein MNR06_00890 [Bdellovibrio reynosensis]